MTRFFQFASPGKTGKREVAVLVLLLWSATFVKIFWFDGAAVIEAQHDLYGELSWPILTFVAAAFGIDAILKRERGGKHTRATDQDRDV